MGSPRPGPALIQPGVGCIGETRASGNRRGSLRYGAGQTTEGLKSPRTEQNILPRGMRSPRSW